MEIGKVDFVLKDLNLYLDTHPYDQQAIEAFRQYNNLLWSENTRKNMVLSCSTVLITTTANGNGLCRTGLGKGGIIKCGIMKKDYNFQ